jgi:hypothetical protein
MTLIILKATPHYVKAGVLYVSEKDVIFDMEYEVVSNVTGVFKKFKFTESTGSEFDPKTEWIYKSEEGYELRICNDNDAETTRKQAEVYLSKIKTIRL